MAGEDWAEGEELLRMFSRHAHTIPINGNDVELLDTPAEFFETLLIGIGTAQRSISLAALYIGIESRAEARFIGALKAAAADPARPELRLQILLDAARATRPCRDQEGSISSTAEVLARELLLPFAGAQRASVALFQTPHSRTSIRRVLPPRVREVLGVQHIKAFAFDDDVVLTGANISGAYLSDRQDRYWVVRRSPRLAAFVHGLVADVSSHSFQLESTATGRGPTDAEAAPPPRAAAPPAPLGEEEGLSRGARRLLHLRHRGSAAAAATRGGPPAPGAGPGSYVLRPAPVGVNPSHTPAVFRRSLRYALLRRFVPGGAWGSTLDGAALRELDDLAPEARGGGDPAAPAAQDTAADTVILPTVQAGFLGLRQEEVCSLALLRRAAAAGGTRELRLSTPYLNLARGLAAALAAAPRLPLRLLTSSPEANGFWGSAGLSRHIPLAYAALEARTWRALAPPRGRPGAAPRVLLEYARPGWQFHAKGLWYGPSAPSAAGQAARGRAAAERPLPPCFTAVGSSNYGARSQRRDLEAQFLVVTRNPRLRAAMEREWAGLEAHAVEVGPAQLQQPARRAGPVVAGLVRLLKGFL
uniref:CDP-diacylglycerol--glycerol-3-phosphate 3-phosphatidyltransferase n=1 Tax=Auxenochlorella protothecoides TaxID=3075 RepID=A0A1D1ZQS1_AUXPR